MITAIVQLLNVDKFYGVSERIDIAKGRDKIPMSVREGWEQIKRSKA